MLHIFRQLFEKKFFFEVFCFLGSQIDVYYNKHNWCSRINILQYNEWCVLPSLESGVAKTAKSTSSWAVTPNSAARSDPGCNTTTLRLNSGGNMAKTVLVLLLNGLQYNDGFTTKFWRWWDGENSFSPAANGLQYTKTTFSLNSGGGIIQILLLNGLQYKDDIRTKFWRW